MAQQSERLSIFIEWFMSNGGFLHSAVEVASGTIGYHLRLRGDCTFPPDNYIVACPSKLTMSILNANLSTGGRSLASISPQSKPHSTIVLLLMTEFNKGKESFWWPYIQILPQPDEQKLNTPLWYEEDDRQWILGTNLDQGRLDREMMWRMEFEEVRSSIVHSLGRSAEFDQQYSFLCFKWAATILSSRSFGSSLFDDLSSGEDHGRLTNNGAMRDHRGSFPVLIPAFDFANHNPAAKAVWKWDQENRACCFMSGEELRAENTSHQIWNNYGPKGNEELIMGYGFSLFKNSADQFGLKYSLNTSPRLLYLNELQLSLNKQSASASNTDAVCLPPSPKGNFAECSIERILALDPSDGTKQARKSRSFEEMRRGFSDQDLETLSRKRTLQPPTGVYYLRLPDHCFGDYQNSIPALSAFPQILLDNMMITHANTRDLRNISITPNRKTIRNSDTRMTTTKIKVVCDLIRGLRRAHSKIVSSDHLLPPWPKNEAQFHAARYRRIQLRILQTVATSCERLVESHFPFSNHPNTSPTHRGGQILHLDNAISHSPPSLKKALKRALKAAFGTHNPQKLESEGLAAAVFTLWLCGLTHILDSESPRAAPPATPNSPPNPSELQQTWLRTFLPIHYCPPPSQHPHPHPQDTCKSLACVHTFDTDGRDYTEADSYLEIIKAARATDVTSSSLFSDERFDDRGFVRWAYFIVMEEGGFCPRLGGRGGEEEEEFVLFLQRDGEAELEVGS